MCVRVSLIGRLGNNLFQYALGRIIAKHLRMELECIQAGFPPGSVAGQSLDVGSPATLTALSAFFPNAPLRIPGLRFEVPIESFETKSGDGWRGQTIDLYNILQNSSPRQIRLRGFFQRFEYYAPFAEEIRQWFRPAIIPIPYTIRPNDILVNIRRCADFGLKGWVLPIAYYENILSSLPKVGQVYVCGTCIDDSIKLRFSKYNPIYYDGSAIEHFGFIMHFNRIVLSNSTFAWWAAFLSHAEQIFAPRFVEGGIYSFTGFEDVDLNMRDRRYCEVPVVGTVRFTLLERDKDVAARGDDRTPLIKQHDGQMKSIQVDDNNRQMVDWILGQNGPVAVHDMARHYHGSLIDFRHSVDDLIHAGVLRLRPTYLEPAEENTNVLSEDCPRRVNSPEAIARPSKRS